MNQVDPTALVVDVVENGELPSRDGNTCEVGKTIVFDPSGLTAYCLGTWDPRVYDALMLAASVQYCDHRKARPKSGWERRFDLLVPVHDPALWNSAKVQKPLLDALNVLTLDRWSVVFVDRKQPIQSPARQSFSMPRPHEAVLPFSDGLDSFLVSEIMERKHGKRILRVRLGPKNKSKITAGRQPEPFTCLPYKVNMKGKSRETSSRTRGFRFAILSGIAAVLSETKTVFNPESGQGSLGPSLVPVGQAYEDVRNHPFCLKKMETLLHAIFEKEISYKFPQLWHTKGETLSEYCSLPDFSEDWRTTISCWQPGWMASIQGKRVQCGICAACLLRRMSVHAAELQEDQGTYLWEHLDASQVQNALPSNKIHSTKYINAQIGYGIAGTLHLENLATTLHAKSNIPGIDRQIFLLSQSLGISASEVRKNLRKLLEKHEMEWRAFLQSLGPNSFLANNQWR